MDEEKKVPRMYPRDGGMRMDLTGGTGAIRYMVPMESLGFMETYTADKTFRMQSPDSIDPARTRPDIPWSWTRSDDAGWSNEVVAQVFIQCAEALKNHTLVRGDPERIKAALHRCKEEMRSCEKVYLRIRDENNRIVEQINLTKGVRAEGNVIGDFPQIENLEGDVGAFLAGARRAMQHVAEVLNEFYGITVSNARFDKARTQLKALNPQPTLLIESLENLAPKIERLLSLRDNLDHTPKKTVVQNFHILPAGLQPPKWSVSPEAPTPLVKEMHSMIAMVIVLVEESFFHGLMDNIQLSPGPFEYAVEEIPEAERDGSEVRLRFIMRFATGGQAPGGPS